MFRTASVSRHLLRILALLVLTIGAAGCAAKSSATLRPASERPLAALQADLAAIFNGPEFHRAVWGVVVQSLDTGETLFSLNPGKLVMPASNMKILTLAASAERLGWDYTFDTQLVATGPIEDGVLKGDLIVIGSGDPSLGGRVGDTGRVFAAWGETLWNAGVRTIAGRIVGDDHAFDDDGIGAGWSWDDLAYGYAAPVGALSYDENAVELVIRPGSAAGQPAELALRPTDGALSLDNQLMTSPPGGEFALDLRRAPGTSGLRVRGAVPLGTSEFVRTVSVDNPTDFFLAALQHALMARGIHLMGAGVDIDVLNPPPDVSNAHLLLSHHSPPLDELAATLMKVSRNLYGEALLKALGSQPGRPGTVQTGRQTVQEVLQTWGIPPDSFILSDGSGLSRYNYVTVETLVAVLQHVAGDVRHATRFEATLPIAGRDGTLGNRMKGTPAEGNVHAKTGTLSNIRALSGYMRTADAERLVFSIVANNFETAPATVDRAADRALVRLAEFRRHPR